jgi:hypothetical protein
MNEKLTEINSKFYQECEVIILPTHDQTQIAKSHKSNHLIYADKPMSDTQNNRDGYTNQHLYILSDEEIKEGDWYMYCHFGEWIISNSRETLKNRTNTLENLNKDSYYKKIIVTTDESLKPSCICSENEAIYCGSKCQKSLPRPSDDFLKAFVKAQGKGFEKVLVEYEDYWVQVAHSMDVAYKVKVAPDNIITIRPVQEEKTSWSREEVITLIQKLEVDGANYFGQAFLKQWISENL